ncbi:hypothetical protein TNCV_4512931 [Trichonephila clavipes]|nr:hypothetical protein TNCV_4512931 [Trichonephila clavipes]
MSFPKGRNESCQSLRHVRLLHNRWRHHLSPPPQFRNGTVGEDADNAYDGLRSKFHFGKTRPVRCWEMLCNAPVLNLAVIWQVVYFLMWTIRSTRLSSISLLGFIRKEYSLSLQVISQLPL